MQPSYRPLMYRKVLEKGRCLEFYGGRFVVFWEVFWDFLVVVFLVKDDIDTGSKKRRKQFIFYTKFNHLFSCGTEWRWQFLSFLASDIFGFAGFKRKSQLIETVRSSDVLELFFFGGGGKQIFVDC